MNDDLWEEARYRYYATKIMENDNKTDLKFLNSVLILEIEMFDKLLVLSDLVASPTVAGFLMGSSKNIKSSGSSEKTRQWKSVHCFD